MPLVSVKDKFQIVIPLKVRRKIGVKVGDLPEATAEQGKITFTPKSVVDRHIAESLADFKTGRSFGPFETPRGIGGVVAQRIGKAKFEKTWS